MDQDVAFVGMDLGAWRTRIMSSMDARDMMLSVVGWPKDHVAQTLLGEDVVFDEDVLKHRLALNIVRPFEKGSLKYKDQEEAGLTREEEAKRREAAALLVQHAVSRARIPEGMPIYGIMGAPARASIKSRQLLIEIAQEVFDLVLVISEPFAVAYGLGRLTSALVIDIGAGTIDLCPMCGSFPREEEQVTVPIGAEAIDEELARRIAEAYPTVQLSRNMAREIKEKFGFLHDRSDPVIVTLPEGGKPRSFDITGPVKQACSLLVEPILRGVCEVVSRFDPEFQRDLLKNIILAGGGSQLHGLDRVLEHSLKDFGEVRVTKVHDAVFAGAAGSLKLAQDLPLDYWTKIKRLDETRVAA